MYICNMKLDISDESLTKWRHFLEGNNEAYCWLYNKYIDALYAYGCRFTTDTETVKDCIQDVFTSLYKNRQNLTVPDNVKVFIMVALKNRLIRTIKREKALYADSDDSIPFEIELASFSVEDEYIENEDDTRQRLLVEQLLSVLKPRQKEIIYYRYVQELGFDEICNLMNISYQSAKNLLQRALVKMRKKAAGI